jgi:hypothetical protein
MAAFPEEPFYRTTIGKYRTLRFGLEPLDLGKTAVQFHSRDVATVIRCEKHYCPSNFVRPAKPAERDCAGYHLATLLTHVTRGEQIVQTGRINGSGADRIDTNPTMLEICGPSSRKRADGSLGSAVNAMLEAIEQPGSVLPKRVEQRSSMVKVDGLWVHQGSVEPGTSWDRILEEVGEERIESVLKV